VIHLGKYYPPATGGIETHTRTLCRSLADLGIDVGVVVVNHANAAGEDVTFSASARTPSVEDRDGPVRVWRVGRLANVAKLDVTPTLPRLLRQLRRNPPDLWHLHTPNITMMLAVAAMKSLRPLVITHHSDIVRQKVLKHAVRPLEKLIYRRAARILPTSAAYAEGSDLLRMMPEKVTPLPLGIDLAPFQKPSPAALGYEAELKTKHGTPLWLAVGRLIYYKALDVAFAALAKLPGKLLVVGTGPMEPAWKAKAAELGVAERVVWLGRTAGDELIGAYRAATAYWFPSNARAEGFGLVQVEAMAAGCPVINTAIAHSGVSWVSPDGVSGLTVPVNDAPAFAAAAQRLLDEPGLRQRLAEGSQARAAAEFDQRTMAERCRVIYSDCLERTSLCSE
jgi:rhamnosyl/mannosyltransferase